MKLTESLSNKFNLIIIDSTKQYFFLISHIPKKLKISL
jgi:hypothetical protein